MGGHICQWYIRQGLISKTYEEPIWLNTRKTIQLRNGQKIWIHTSPKRTHRWPTDMKKCSTSLAIRKMQIKTTMRYHHLTPAKWLPLINQQTISAGEDVEKREPYCTVDGNADWCSYHEKQCEIFWKIYKQNCLLIQQFHCWEYALGILKHQFKIIYAPLCL